MEAPFGIFFLRKLEFYNIVKDQRKKAAIMLKENPYSKNPITWYVEEQIYFWTYV